MATPAIDTRALTQRLVTELGPTMVAVVAQTRDRKAPERWAAGSEAVPETSLERLVFLEKIFLHISRHESADIARAWLIGSNSGLGCEQPFIVIAKGRFNDVDAAATRLISDIPD